MWTIYYSDSVVHGNTKEEWIAAPDSGVQVVVHWRIPEIHERPWTNVDDRILWTGEDEYDPFGWGIKYGELISDEKYFSIWELAAYGNSNP